MEIINLLLNFLFGISGIISMITIIDTKTSVDRGGGGSPAPALKITIISEAEVRRRRGRSGGTPTPTPTLTEVEKKALITREQINIESQQRGRAFTRREVRRRLGFGEGVSALRSARAKGFGTMVEEEKRTILKKRTKEPSTFASVEIPKRRISKLQSQISKAKTEEEKGRLQKILKKLKESKIVKKVIPTFDKEVGKKRREKVKSFFTKKELKRQTGFNLFEKESDKNANKIFNEVSTFADSRLNFYQGRVNTGVISVNEAEKKFKRDIEKKENELINKNEFFREKNPRIPTTSAVSFQYETNRLKAVKSGDKKAENVSLFLRIVSETPSSLVRLGIGAKKGIKKLINDPKARETSLDKIKEVFTIEGNY